MSKGENMVERCARALCAADGQSWKEPPYNRLHTDAGNNYWRFKARAVIEALMTPTPEVCQAVYNMTGGHYVVGDFPPIWQTAIRTILSQPNDEGEGK